MSDDWLNNSIIKIFGYGIDLNNIAWHMDDITYFEYPIKRCDKIRISKWFNKSIDVKLSREALRFYFAIRMAQNYQATKNEKYYSYFRILMIDWIEKNPFYYG